MTAAQMAMVEAPGLTQMGHNGCSRGFSRGQWQTATRASEQEEPAYERATFV
jgi:hypothetical protein